MSNHSVVILAVVAVLAIAGLVISSAPAEQGAAVARPLIGNECMDVVCPEGLESAKLKQFEGYVYCACGLYETGKPSQSFFDYELRYGNWVES